MAFFALAVLGIVVFIATQPPPAPPPAPPVPNGYTNLIQAALLLKGEAPQKAETDRDHYSAYVATNQAALGHARLALTYLNTVPRRPGRAKN